MPGMMDTVLNIGLNDQTAQGMIALTSDAHFVYDAYRRLVQMLGSAVMGVADEPFEEVLTDFRARRGVKSDSDLSAEDLKAVKDELKKIVKAQTGREFPADPMAQLKLAIEAVFKSWNGKCAVDYRNAAKIPHDLGTAVNIVTMVFGNIDSRCAISQASADLLVESVVGKTLDEMKALSKDDMLGMLGIELGPVRLKCAPLSLKVLKAGVYGLEEIEEELR